MYGRDLCPGTATVAEQPYKEPWKLANEAILAYNKSG